MIFSHWLLFVVFYLRVINGMLLSDYYNYYLNNFEYRNDNKLYEEISINFIKFFEKNIDDNTSCLQNLNIDNVSIILRYSDIDITFDKSNEKECKNHTYVYYLFSYQFYSSPFIDVNKNESFNFFEDSIYSTGICLPKNCSEMINSNFENNSIKNDSKIYNYLYNNFNIRNITLWNKELNDKSKPDRIVSSAEIIFFFIIFYIVIVFTIGFVGIYYIKNNDKEIENILNEDDVKEKKEQNKESYLFSKEHENNSLLIMEKEKDNIRFIITIFNPIENLKIYLNDKSYLFNSSNLEFFSTIRVIILFLCIYNYQFYIITKYHPNVLSKNSLFGCNFFILKLSSYSVIIHCLLDGFIAIFKFMNFYKTKKFKNIKFIIFKFFLFCTPKIILFIINFYIFHYLFPELLEYIGFKNDLNDDFYLSYFKNFDCEKEIFKMFIPLYYEYKNYNDISKCYSFVFIYKNEFISFIVSLILFSILLYIQNHIIDLIISVIILLNLLIFPFILKTSPKVYGINSIFGNITYFTTPNIFFSCYIIGGFFGLMYFYYLDIISSNRFPFLYKPFSFIDYIISKIDMFSPKRKVFSCLILILSLFLISINYNILRYFLGGDSINFELNFVAKIIYHYEMFFVIFVFLFLFIILLLYEKLRISFPLFNFIERINSTIFSNLDSFIQMSFCFFDFNFNLNYHDLFFISLGQYFIIIILSGFISILFEIPLKVLIKRIITNK